MIVIHNRGFDRPRVAKAHGMVIPIEHTQDTMDQFHVLHNAFKRTLGFVTSLMPSSWRLPMWKHMNKSNPELYSCLDALALLRNHYDCEALTASTGATPVWTLLHKRLDPVLDFMSQKGMLISIARHKELQSVLTADMEAVIAKMNEVVPSAVRSPKVWKTLKGAESGRETLVANAQRDGESWERLQSAELFVVPGVKKVAKCTRCGKIEVKADHVTRKFAVTPKEVK